MALDMLGPREERRSSTSFLAGEVDGTRFERLDKPTPVVPQTRCYPSGVLYSLSSGICSPFPDCQIFRGEVRMKNEAEEDRKQRIQLRQRCTKVCLLRQYTLYLIDHCIEFNATCC